MKKVMIFVLFFCTSSSIILSQTTETRLVSKKIGFEITFPSGFPTPKHEITNDGMVMFTTENNRGACLVSYNIFDHSLFKVKTIDKILSDVVTGYLQNNSTLISEKNIILDNYKGKSVRFESKDNNTNFFNRFDCYVFGDVLLQVAFVAYNKNELSKKDLDNYFKSLSFIKNQLEIYGIEFNSDEENFRINIPSGFTSPKISRDNIKSDLGLIPTTMYSTENQNGACIISCSTYPDVLFERKTSEKILNDAMEGALKSQNFQLLSKQILLRDDLPGLSFIVKTKDKRKPIYIRYEYCIKQPKLYQVAYSTYSLNELNSTEVQNYFKSFEILDK